MCRAAGTVHSRKRRRVAARPERDVLEKRYRTHSVPRVARSVRRLVAGCAAGCGVGNQAVLTADLNAHSLCTHLKGHERSGNAPVSEPAPIDLLGPCAFR